MEDMNMSEIADGWVLLGHTWVDSGQLVITDPCYLSDWAGHEFGEENPGEYSFAGACTATLTGPGGVIGGHAADGETVDEGRGVVFGTGWGDGSYPVYAKIEEGRVFGVFIDFGARDIDTDGLRKIRDDQEDI
jgi:hypothetical protein